MADNLQSVISELGSLVASVVKQRESMIRRMNRNKLSFFWNNDSLVWFLDCWVFEMLRQGADPALIVDWLRWLDTDVIKPTEQFIQATRNFVLTDPDGTRMRLQLQFPVSPVQIELLNRLLLTGHECYWKSPTRRQAKPKPFAPFPFQRF